METQSKRVWVAALAIVLPFLVTSGHADTYSIRPLVSSDDSAAVYEPLLLGKWTGFGSYEVTRFGKSGYHVTVEEEKGVSEKAEWSLTLIRSGENFIMDFGSQTDVGFTLHWFARLRIEGDKLWVALLEMAEVEAKIMATKRPRCEVMENGYVLLTAPTNELRRYFLPLLKDSKAFTSETEFNRLK